MKGTGIMDATTKPNPKAVSSGLGTPEILPAPKKTTTRKPGRKRNQSAKSRSQGSNADTKAVASRNKTATAKKKAKTNNVARKKSSKKPPAPENRAATAKKPAADKADTGDGRAGNKRPRKPGATQDPAFKEVVQHVHVADLHPHPRNAEIYRAQPTPEFVASIKKHGVQQPLIVNEETGNVIDGNSRLYGARVAGLEKVPALQRRYNDELDELQALLDLNKGRVKTDGEIGNELLLRLEIEGRRAKKRMSEGGKSAGRGRPKGTPNLVDP